MDTGDGDWLRFLLPTLVVLGVLAGVCFALVLVLWMDSGREHRRMWDKIEKLDDRAPCDGCFESLKWRVDKIEAREGAHDETRPEAGSHREDDSR